MPLARRGRHMDNTISVTELEWLCRGSYNLALKLLMGSPAENVLVLLNIAKEVRLAILHTISF